MDATALGKQYVDQNKMTVTAYLGSSSMNRYEKSVLSSQRSTQTRRLDQLYTRQGSVERESSRESQRRQGSKESR